MTMTEEATIVEDGASKHFLHQLPKRVIEESGPRSAVSRQRARIYALPIPIPVIFRHPECVGDLTSGCMELEANKRSNFFRRIFLAIVFFEETVLNMS